MSKMKTITLEILRQGPPHNQLLSPLTNYLFLCGNHPPETVNIPFEHRQILTRLRALRYMDSTETTRRILEEFAENLGNIFSRCPELIAEVNVDKNKQENMMLHLRLILSANELALLPFESIISPNGFPGPGQPLSLQTEMPVCITRETRRRVINRFQWPENPKILFIAACPPGLPPIPLRAHCLIFRRVIDPWIKYDQQFKNKRNLKEKIGERLQIILNASLEKIQNTCSQGDFTHIHILAHGVPYQDDDGKHFALALHDNADEGKMKKVKGDFLANAILTCMKDRQGAINSPAVVTIASCDSGQTGSIIGTGASIAHALHEAGVPLVVASQFPLSFMGSVIMTQTLYDGLLWGNDPRELLYNLRKQLKTENCEIHDWASLVAYASFPPDIDKQLLNIQFKLIKTSIDAALGYADEILSKKMLSEIVESATDEKQSKESKDKILLKDIKDIISLVEKAEKRLVKIPIGEYMKYLLLGSTDKRLSYILYRKWLLGSYRKSKSKTAQKKDTSLDESLDLIIKARDNYLKSYKLKKSSSWPLVQYLSLAAYIETIKNNGGIYDYYKEPEKTSPPCLPLGFWNLALKLAESDLENLDMDTQIWAHGDLCELYLLAPMVKNGGKKLEKQSKGKAAYHVEQMIKLCKEKQEYFPLESTYRQISRYPAWFQIPDLRENAFSIIDVFQKDDILRLLFQKTKS